MLALESHRDASLKNIGRDIPEHFGSRVTEMVSL
jgi:hypothetical protein